MLGLAAVALAGLGAAAQAHVPARAAGGAPDVTTMVVGSGNRTLAQARAVSASAVSAGIRGRACAVAAGTPLAALAALRRAGGPGFALRDYGRCGGSQANSAQLFVYSLGGQSNRGQSGWEYKVDGVSGSTGSADTSGPQGNGRRLASGDQLLWFWCEAQAGGCQRTLQLSPSDATVPRGGSATVTVYGADNEGRLAFMPDAIVTFGGRSARTGSYGHATLTAPSAPGRYAITAARPGSVPTFPGTIVVR
ncbi:MAG TPA: hypothetical protein VF380_05500 [Solirubrobacteraceae bacterium]